MKFSLIVGTLNRRNELQHCLNSLLQQAYKDYEVIIVDQSEDDETKELVNTYNDQRIIYNKVDFKGLSKARNYGLKIAGGDYFCLIDDDAYYDESFLANAYSYLKEKELHRVILSGYIFDTDKEGDFAKYKESLDGRYLSLSKILNTCPSAGLVVPMDVIKECGGFDEELGVGARFGAGEETDLLIRVYKKGFKVIYRKNLSLKHPYPPKEKKPGKEEKAEKMGAYYRGFGAVYKKHVFQSFHFYMFLRYLVVWMKLIVKRLLPFKYDKNRTKAEIKGFKEGLKQYGAKR